MEYQLETSSPTYIFLFWNIFLKLFNPKPTASPAQQSVSSCTLPVQTDEDCTFCECLDGEVLCDSWPNCDPVNKSIQETFETCTYAGGVYEHLDTFSDDCNLCSCYDGAISCTGDSFLLCQEKMDFT